MNSGLSQNEIVSVMGLTELYIPVTPQGEIYDSEDPGDRVIDFKDLAMLVESMFMSDLWWPSITQ